MIAPGVAYFFFTIEEKPIIYSEYKKAKSKQSFVYFILLLVL